MTSCEYHFDSAPYDKRVYWGFGKAELDLPSCVDGPNIKAVACAWSRLPTTSCCASAPRSWIAVTTTDELIPSGETSSYPLQPARPGRVHALPPRP